MPKTVLRSTFASVAFIAATLLAALDKPLSGSKLPSDTTLASQTSVTTASSFTSLAKPSALAKGLRRRAKASSRRPIPVPAATQTGWAAQLFVTDTTSTAIILDNPQPAPKTGTHSPTQPPTTTTPTTTTR